MHLISGISSLLSLGLLTPVQSILALITLFVSTSICLYNQNFVLIGILYVLIYVGAIAILFLFILSLLNIEYKNVNKVSPLIVTLLIISLIPIDLSYESQYIVTEINHVYKELVIVGYLLYTEYAVLILLLGIILILSVIGAISITK